MQPTAAPRRPASLLVSDFDGTMTRHDFYRLAVASLLPRDVHDYWADYRAGRITHFEALRGYFAAIRASEPEVRAVVDRMELDPALSGALARLRAAGWEVVVTSAGCDWYIRILLAEAGVDGLAVWSNPGRFEEGRGLLMELPRGIPYFSPSLGVDKAEVVRRGIAQGRCVAFAGDGFPDVDPARLVPPGLRFARGDLAHVLAAEGLPFRAFDRWSEIADALCGLPRPGPGSHPSETTPAEHRP